VVRTLSGELANRIGLKGIHGVIVIDVLPGSPAEDGGLEEGDVIVTCLGRPAESEREFSQMIKNVRPGQVVILRVVRKGTARIIGFRAE
jgi:serine protease Do